MYAIRASRRGKTRCVDWGQSDRKAIVTSSERHRRVIGKSVSGKLMRSLVKSTTIHRRVMGMSPESRRRLIGQSANSHRRVIGEPIGTSPRGYRKGVIGKSLECKKIVGKSMERHRTLIRKSLESKRQVIGKLAASRRIGESWEGNRKASGTLSGSQRNADGESSESRGQVTRKS